MEHIGQHYTGMKGGSEREARVREREKRREGKRSVTKRT